MSSRIIQNSGEHFAILYYLKDDHYKKLFDIVDNGMKEMRKQHIKV